ncbi:Flp/Fap pilin component [Moorella thermoacetica]|uniref:Flp/Fap pilin component n=1 Tax=Neomoorella thermoacetica TaxID=1525 RepID=A0A1J5NWS4_NEOTH|nr:Flp/Fap pilin component [Moorella thermoacetica]
MLQKIRSVIGLLNEERGGVLSEYGLLIALVAVACIAAMIFLGKAIAGKFKDVGTQIQNAQPVQ